MRGPCTLRGRVLAGLLTVGTLGAIAISPARADEKKTTFVRPADMPAAEAARKKATEGRKLLKEGKHAEGVQMVDEAVGELERTTGPDSDFSKTNRDVAVSVYQSLKQPDKAAAVLKRAEAARKTWKAPTPEPANANTAAAMSKMQAGLVALKANDFVKAAELLEQALPDLAKSDVSEKVYLLIAGVLASLYDYSQQFSKGEALRKDVIAKMAKKLGDDSPEVAEQYASLATHYMQSADEQKAISAQKKSVELTRKKLPGSTELADRLMTLSGLQINTGDTEAGHATLLEAMTVVRGITPVDPLRVVRVARALVQINDLNHRARSSSIDHAATDDRAGVAAVRQR